MNQKKNTTPENEDIRWEQRFSNFNKAYDKLKNYVHYINKEILNDNEIEEEEQLRDVLNELVKQGLIQSFEYTHELAWNVMKDYATYQGKFDIRGSRDATREAYSIGLISNGEIWMEMIASRNASSHTYNEEIANEIFMKIIKDFLPAFSEFQNNMEEIRTGKQGTIFD